MDLSVSFLFKTSFIKALHYYSVLLVNILLYILTVWIPYFNIGTSIGLFIGIPAHIAKGEQIAYNEIFKSSYRKNMGELFLNLGIGFLGILVGYLFLIVPGIVLSVAWMLGPLLVVDKGYGPIAAMKKSSELTYGKKETIFFAQLAIQFVVQVGILVVINVLSLINPYLGLFAIVVCHLFAFCINICFKGIVYGSLHQSA